MTGITLTDGNLALALEPTRPVFTVIDGSALHPRKSAVETVRPANALHTLIRAALALFIVASAIACSLQFLSAGQASYDRALASEERMTITVSPDDTLWDIAEAHPADNVSTRQTVDIVRAWNDLSDGMLRAGETLVVPA